MTKLSPGDALIVSHNGQVESFTLVHNIVRSGETTIIIVCQGYDINNIEYIYKNTKDNF